MQIGVIYKNTGTILAKCHTGTALKGYDIIKYKGGKYMAKTSNAVKDRWNSQNYDDIRIRVPKGQKQTILRAAQESGESINAYTTKALLMRMGLEQWPESEE